MRLTKRITQFSYLIASIFGAAALCVVPIAHGASTVSSLHAGPVFSTLRHDAVSYLRFHNTGNAAGKVTVIVRDATTGNVLGEWISPSIEVGTIQQYWIGTIEGALALSSVRPERYVVDVKSGISGQFQHVVVNSASSVLTNASTCSSSVIAEPHLVSSVHSSVLSKQGYPSLITVTNPGSTEGGVRLGIYDALTGIKIGTYDTPAVCVVRTFETDAGVI